MNYLLIVCLSTIVLTVLRTFRRGTSGIYYAVLTWIISVFIVSSRTLPVTNFLIKTPQIHDYIVEKVSPYIDIAGQVDSIISGMGESLGEDASAEDFVKKYFQDFAGTEEQMDAYEDYVLNGTPMENSGSDIGSEIQSILENTSGGDDSVSAASNELQKFALEFIFEIMAMIICYLMAKVLLIIFRIVIFRLNKDHNDRLPTLSILWGIVEGVLYVDVYLMLITRLQFFKFGNIAMGLIKADKILSFLYEHNVIEHFI